MQIGTHSYAPITFGKVGQPKKSKRLRNMLALGALGLAALVGCSPKQQSWLTGNYVDVNHSKLAEPGVTLGMSTESEGDIFIERLACQPTTKRVEHVLDHIGLNMAGTGFREAGGYRLPTVPGQVFADGTRISQDGKQIIFPNGMRLDCRTGQLLDAQGNPTQD